MCSHTFVSPKGNRDIHVFCFSFISNQVWSKENQVHLFPKRNLTSCVGGSHTHFCEVHDSSPLCCRRWTARATADMAQATCEHDSPNLKHVKVIFLLWEWWKNITVNKSLFVFIFKQVCVFRAVSTKYLSKFLCVFLYACLCTLSLSYPAMQSQWAAKISPDFSVMNQRLVSVARTAWECRTLADTMKRSLPECLYLCSFSVLTQPASTKLSAPRQDLNAYIHKTKRKWKLKEI
jgi:hypothetical protein